MKRLAAVFLLLLPGAAWCQDVDLSIKGGGAHVVQVDKIVVVKIDTTVVDSFPFTVIAPKLENTRYTWTVPPGVYAVPKGNVLEIRSAPKGEVVVDLYQETFDFNAGKLTGRSGSTTFVVGAPVPPIPPKPVPPDPDPKPVPVPDDFSKAIAAAYQLEPSATRKALATDLAAVYRVVGKKIRDDDVIIKTAGQAQSLLAGTVAAHTTLSKGGLPLVKDVVRLELNKLALKNAELLTDLNRVFLASTLERAAVALEAQK